MINLNKEVQQIIAASKTVKTREFFRNIVGINNICIGGSAALLLAHDIYLERPIHDIDVILEERDFKLAISKIKNLCKFFEIPLKMGSSAYKDKKGNVIPSISFVLKDGTEINILEGSPSGQWQSLEQIVKAKKRYNRPKDQRDLIIILG